MIVKHAAIRIEKYDCIIKESGMLCKFPAGSQEEMQA